jgi:hypothetical protein
MAGSPTLLGVGFLLISTSFQDAGAGAPMFKLPMPDLWDLFGNIFFAPLAETATLAVGLLILRKTSLSVTANSLICAAAFGVLHGVLQGWSKFPVAAWGFYFFANGFQVWSATSIGKGTLAALLPQSSSIPR